MQANTSAYAVIGRGRLGSAIARALSERGESVEGPLGRGVEPHAEIVLLCVPDRAIAELAASIAPGLLIGHFSGASGHEALGGREGFSLHPLMTFTADLELSIARLHRTPAALDASTPAAHAAAEQLAEHLGLVPFELAGEDRLAYHAAATIASNFLITLEAAAERLAASAGIKRALLGPLVRASVENWLEAGAQRSLTGPIARGDTDTVEAQRSVIAARAPELTALFDELCNATHELALAEVPAR